MIKKAMFDPWIKNHVVYLLLSHGMILIWGRFTILMPFPRKKGDGKLIENRSNRRRKNTLRHRRKVAFIQRSLHPLPDCSEEKGNKFQKKVIKKSIHFLKLRKMAHFALFCKFWNMKTSTQTDLLSDSQSQRAGLSLVYICSTAPNIVPDTCRCTIHSWWNKKLQGFLNTKWAT